MPTPSSLLFAILISIGILAPAHESMAQTSPAPSAARVVSANDNTRPAGLLEGNVLTVRLYADVGSARPAGPKSTPIEIAAFGEEGAGLSAPGPIIRVREGTTVVLTLRNALGTALRVEGLCARPGPCKPVSVAAGASQEVRFDSERTRNLFLLGHHHSRAVAGTAPSRHPAWRRDRGRAARGIASGPGVRDLDLRKPTPAKHA